MESRSNKNPGN